MQLERVKLDREAREEGHARRLEIERLYDARPKLFADVRHLTRPRAIKERMQQLRAQIVALRHQQQRQQLTATRQRRLRRLAIEYRLLQHKLVFYASCPLPMLAPWLALHATEQSATQRGTEKDKRRHTLLLLNAMLCDKSREEIARGVRHLQRIPAFAYRVEL